MRTITLAVTLMLAGFNLFSQEKAKKTEEVIIKTSAQCEMCKEKIEKEVLYEKGVKSAVLNLETNELKVEYKPEKTNPENIRKAIARVGYDADDVKADEKAYEKLPYCCKKPK
jgi:periplasmic mercuric ion binding protein